MELKPLENTTSQEWDRIISAFDSKAIFHQSVWLNFIEKTQGIKRTLLKIEKNNKTIGYFPCFIFYKGPFKILGSPCVGWVTNFMGPVVNKNNFNQQNFLNALENYCKSQKIVQIEISNPVFEPVIMKSYGFNCREDITYILDLSPNEEEMWKNLRSECRTAIRKAINNNLIAEDTNDPQIIDEYYSQLREVFARQRLTPTYSYKTPQALFDCLKKEDLLFSLRVKLGQEVIATGLFSHDDRDVYFFGGASRQKFYHLRPNNFLHWELMKIAAKRGILRYETGGGGFKQRFGGKLIKKYHWYKSYNLFAKFGRKIYKHQFRILQRLKGKLKFYEDKISRK